MITAAWLLGFAVVHVYWAAGGRLGMPDGTAPISDRPVFLAYDIAAAIGLVVLSILVRTQHRTLLRVAGALLLLRGAVGLTQAAFGDVGLVGYDVWFAIAGVLVLYTAGRTSSRSSASRSPVAPAATPRRPRITT